MRFSHGRSCRAGKRPDLNGVYFRSSWEANYARYLNLLIAGGAIRSWTFESETFTFPIKRGNTFYTPDFVVVLPDGNKEYHEVKGYMDDVSRVKIARFKKYNPDLTFVLIDRPVYESIARQFKRTIPSWE